MMDIMIKGKYPTGLSSYQYISKLYKQCLQIEKIIESMVNQINMIEVAEIEVRKEL